jgi:hypothetical protein
VGVMNDRGNAIFHILAAICIHAYHVYVYGVQAALRHPELASRHPELGPRDPELGPRDPGQERRRPELAQSPPVRLNKCDY